MIKNTKANGSNNNATIDFTSFKLDTVSDYIIDGHNVGVMLTATDEIYKKFVDFIGGAIEYLDFYANIDTRVDLVTDIQVVATYDNDKYYLTFDIPTEYQPELFNKFYAADQEGLKDVFESAKAETHQCSLEDTATIIETFEDFLTERGVKIPSSEELKREAGDNDENTSVIYGEDFGELCDKVMALMDETQSVNARWFNTWRNYAVRSCGDVDELDFVTEAIERGITPEQVFRITGSKDTAEWFETFAKEHGLIA